jgi:uncharacterized coiled-coil protein SlyX
VTQDIEAKLSHYNEAKEELRLLKQNVAALEEDILRTLKEKENPPSEIPFDYAGNYYRAVINIDRTVNRAPNQDDTIEAIRKMLPEGEQTTEKAKAHYQSLYKEKPVRDSVTIRSIKKPDDKNAEKSE